MMEFYVNDFAALVFSVVLFGGYQTYVIRKSRADSHYSIQQVIGAARVAWVEMIMRERRDVLAVQTLRNSIMAATFLASTAILLIVGVLTLSEQGDKLSSAWHALNFLGYVAPQIWLVKLFAMLLDLLVAFFSFAMAIRLFHHVGFLVNVPIDSHEFAKPRHVAAHLNRAGRFYSIGTRAYYLLVPLLFWLFGPHFLVLATVLLVWILYHLDRSPRRDADLTG
jgi:uncharacterized membrane protein